MAGADRPPSRSMTCAPMLSSWAVVTPGRTSRFIASSTWRTSAPAARKPARSSGPLIDMNSPRRILRETAIAWLADVADGPARAKEGKEDETCHVEVSHLGKRKSNEAQDQSEDRYGFRKSVGHDMSGPPAVQGSRI